MSVDPVLEELVADLLDARSQIQRHRDREAEITELIARHIDRGERVVIEGIGAVEVKRGKDRTEWDHDALWRQVVAYARDERQVDPETGEYESEGEAVARVLGECARPSWRLTPLRARGIDPDEYSASSPGRLSVVIR